MDCKEFQHWLRTRDIHDSHPPQDAVSHMAACPECRALFNTDKILETGITRVWGQQPLPPGLMERIDIRLDPAGTAPRPSWSWGARMTALATILTAFLAIAMALPIFKTGSPPVFKNPDQLCCQAAADHLGRDRERPCTLRELDRDLALMTEELGFKVLVPDLDGCRIMGGRLCNLGDCRAAYFALEQAGKTGSLFILGSEHLGFSMAENTRFTTRLKGCDTSVWMAHGQVYAMVF